MPKHYPLSPSGSNRILEYSEAAGRWVPVCPGSLRQSFGLKSPSSAYSDTGTELHELTVESILAGKIPDSLNDVVHRRLIAVAMKHVRAIRARFAPGYVEEFEVTIVHNEIDDFGGTIDHAIRGYIGKKKVQWINDFKFGFEEVKALWNPQLHCYSELLRQRDTGWVADEYYGSITHPQTLSLDVAQIFPWAMESFIESLLEFVEFRWLNPGPKQCQYCPSVSRCPAVTALVDDALGENGIAENLSPERAAHFRSNSSVITKFFERLGQDMKDRIFKGESFPGFALKNRAIGRSDWKAGGYEMLLDEFGLKADDFYEKLSKTALIDRCKMLLDDDDFSLLKRRVSELSIPASLSQCLVKDRVGKSKSASVAGSPFEDFAESE